MSSKPTYDDGTNVLVRFHHIKFAGPKAKSILFAMAEVDVDGVWFPKSEIAYLDPETGEVWVPEWLAKKRGVDYE